MNESTTSLAAVATAVSGISATTTTYGYDELSDGTIVVARNGTIDSIQTVSATLTGPTNVYSNTRALGDTQGIAIGKMTKSISPTRPEI
jgi:hypothetical protein